MGSQPLAQRISIVVLTHNRANELIATLGRLLALPGNPPVVVADNASDDDTIALVKALYPGVGLVECSDNLGAAGRNHAAARVCTDYVAFCDDDTWWEGDSLDRAVQLLDAWPNVGVLSARVVVGNERTLDPTCAIMRASPLGSAGLPGPALIGYMAGACVFRTALFRSVGGYEPRLFIGGEEELVALDALARGHAIVYCHSLSVHHRPSTTRDSRLRRRMVARNVAWIACLRLPWLEAWRATLRACGVFMREGTFARDSIALLRGLAWILPRRRVVPSHVLRLRKRVQTAERRGSASASSAGARPAMDKSDART